MGKQINQLPVSVALSSSDIMEVEQYYSGAWHSAKLTLLDLKTYCLSASTLNAVLTAGNTTSGKDIVLTNGDNIKSTAGNITMGYGGSGAGEFFKLINQTGAQVYLDTTGVYLEADGTFTNYIAASPTVNEITHSIYNKLNAPLNQIVGNIEVTSGTATSLVTLNGSKLITTTALSTGFIKWNGSAIVYDNSTYLTTSSAASAYQPLDADLTSWALITRASGFDTFVTTPSSANFYSLLTTKTGTTNVVFSDSPTFTTNVTFNSNITFTPTVNSSLTGSNARIPSHTTANIVFTNASLTSIGSANNGGISGGHTLSISNNTGNSITIVNNYGSAAAGEAIYTGRGTDIILPNNTTLWLQYNATASAWECIVGGLVPVNSISGLGSGIATWLATPSSANLYSAMTTKTGNSSNLVFADSPTFTTNITTPLILGGSAVGSNISYQSTSGTGTTTAAAHIFTGGTNGGTTIATLYNNGQINIGNYATPTSQRLLTIGQDTGWLTIGSCSDLTSQIGLFFNNTTFTFANAVLRGATTATVLNVPDSGGSVDIRVGSTSMFKADRAQNAIQFLFTQTSRAGNTTASAENPNLKVVGAAQSWAAGAITTQRWNYFTANTAAFASASTITDSYGLYVEAAIAGTNATITNNWAAGFAGNSIVTLNQNNFTVFRVSNTTSGTTAAASLQLQNDANTANILLVSTGNSTYRVNSMTFYNPDTGGYSWRSSSNVEIARFSAAGVVAFTPIAQATGAISNFQWTNASNTNQTASTEIPGFLYNSYSRQWATGDFATQRERWYKTVTYTAVGASTITTAYGAYFEAPTASTNVTITNNYAAGFAGNLFSSGTVFNFTAGTTVTIGTTDSFNLQFKTNGTVRGIFYNSTSGFTIGSTGHTTFADLGITAASKSVSAWTTNGIGISMGSMSYTDTSSTGTVASAYTNYIRGGTILASNATTYTNYYGTYLTAATAGSNATITNNYALGGNGSYNFTDGTRSLTYILNANSVLTNTGDTSSQLKAVSGTRTLNMQAFSADTNYIDSTGSSFRIRTTDANNIQFWTNATSRWSIASTGEFTSVSTGTFTASSVSSGAAGGFIYSLPSNTGQTASTEINGFLYNSFTRTWAAGAIATQRERYYKSVTWAFASASTITNGYAAFFEKPTAGSNATITNNWAIGTDGGIFVNAVANTVLANAALSTSATSGFLYIPTSAGAPTGVPTSFTGTVAMQYDTTNNKLYIYNGAWKSVTLT